MNNDFHDNKTIFELLEDLEVKDLTTPIETPTNGASEAVTNGSNGVAAAATN